MTKSAPQGSDLGRPLSISSYDIQHLRWCQLLLGTAQTGRPGIATGMAFFTVLAAVLAAVAALFMFLLGELTLDHCRRNLLSYPIESKSTCCRQAGQGALCGTAFQVSQEVEVSVSLACGLGPAFTKRLLLCSNTCMLQQPACGG